MQGGAAEILTLTIFEDFDPNEKSEQKIPGEEVSGPAELKLHQKEKI